MMVRGTVVRGKGEARGLGYPTANIAHEASGLAAGIFLARALVGTRVIRGVAVVGMWTDEATGHPSLEIHLLDFAGDLYGQTVDVALGEKLRDLMRFDAAEALVARIRKDVEDARALFDAAGPAASLR